CPTPTGASLSLSLSVSSSAMSSPGCVNDNEGGGRLPFVSVWLLSIPREVGDAGEREVAFGKTSRRPPCCGARVGIILSPRVPGQGGDRAFRAQQRLRYRDTSGR